MCNQYLLEYKVVHRLAVKWPTCWLCFAVVILLHTYFVSFMHYVDLLCNMQAFVFYHKCMDLSIFLFWYSLSNNSLCLVSQWSLLHFLCLNISLLWKPWSIFRTYQLFFFRTFFITCICNFFQLLYTKSGLFITPMFFYAKTSSR